MTHTPEFETPNLSWSFRRAWLIGQNAFREAIRMKFFAALMVLALAAFASSFVFREFNFGASELKFIADFGFGGLSLFGSILTVILTVQLFLGEIEHRTALTLLAKPVRRSEYTLGKYIGAMIAIACFVASLTLALALALWIRETQLIAESPDLFPEGRVMRYGDILMFGVMHMLRLGVLSALVVLFCTYATSTMFAMLMGFLVWIGGQLQHVATEAWVASGTVVSKLGYAFVSLLLPNFHLFDIGDKIALGEAIALSGYAKAMIYGLLYASFYLTVSFISFSKREL
ncbi:MAG: ABC transporter permease [Verrucomicrobiota bacterium]